MTQDDLNEVIQAYNKKIEASETIQELERGVDMREKYKGNYNNFNELENDQKMLAVIDQTLRIIKSSKPEERGEKARRYAITITEMEKVAAYFKMYVVDAAE